MDQGRRQHYLLAHTVRIALQQFIAPPAQLEESQQVFGLLPGAIRRHPVEVGHQGEKFSGGELAVEPGLIGNVSDQRLGPCGLCVDVVTADSSFARGGFKQPREHPNGGGLTGAVGTEEAVDFTGVNLQIEMIHGGNRAKFFGETPGFDQCFFHCVAPLQTVFKQPVYISA